MAQPSGNEPGAADSTTHLDCRQQSCLGHLLALAAKDAVAAAAKAEATGAEDGGSWEQQGRLQIAHQAAAECVMSRWSDKSAPAPALNWLIVLMRCKVTASQQRVGEVTAECCTVCKAGRNDALTSEPTVHVPPVY